MEEGQPGSQPQFQENNSQEDDRSTQPLVSDEAETLVMDEGRQESQTEESLVGGGQGHPAITVKEAPKPPERYAVIVMGLKGGGKSTYCKTMLRTMINTGRKACIMNLDPTAGILPYEKPIFDIRDHVTAEEYNQVENFHVAMGHIGRGFEYVLDLVSNHPEWVMGGYGDVPESPKYILFDCPGDEELYAHLNGLKIFVGMLVIYNVKIASVFVADALTSLDGYSFIASCFTPVVSYINLAVPHLSVFMKMDLVNDEDKARLLLFINSEMPDILRYANNQSQREIAAAPAAEPSVAIDASPTVAPTTSPVPQNEYEEMSQFVSNASVILDGHNLVQKKYVPLDIREERDFQAFLTVVDDVLGFCAEGD